MKDNKAKEEKMVRHALVMVMQLGIIMIVPILLMTGLGYFLDQALKSSVCTIIGILVGIAAGFNAVYQQIKQYLKDEESPGQKARRLEEEAKEAFK